mmetsp:Transcript_2247/g.2194  ORF Transcript_2247/g.2194 Transcript_2247/m.2194 type:complete len:102 (+) Transcript_2247:116-421(+)
MAYTGRFFTAEEALKVGYVSYVEENQEATFKKALEIANTIASKSPLAINVLKKSITYSRDHTVADGLNHIANLNALALQTKDMEIAVMATMSKQKAEFPKL